MHRQELESLFGPVLSDVADRSRVADNFIDKNLYRIYIATLWANVVLDPADVGIGEDDLETLHEVLNGHVTRVLGAGSDVRSCFHFITTTAGEQAMQLAHLTQNHQDLLLYFSSMILDPDGHRRWMTRVDDDLP